MGKGTMKSGVGKVYWFFVLSFVVMMVWEIIVHTVSTIYYERSLGTSELATKAIANNIVLNQFFNMSMELALLLFVFFYVKKVDKQPFSLKNFDISLKKNDGKLLFIGFLITLIMKVIAIIVLVGIGVLHFKSLGFSSFSGGEVIGYTVLMLISTLFPGVIEEILYRGYIQKQLAERKGPVYGLIITTLLFTLSHIVIYGVSISLATVLVLGFALGLLYMKTKSLLLPIGFHFGWDFTNHLIADGKEAALIQFSKISGASENILALTFIVLIVLFIIGYGVTKRGDKEINYISK